MPTRGRPALARKALECWQNQTYPLRELVIVDDRDSRSFPDGVQLDGVRYHLLERRLSVGAKRNIACSRAAGQVFMSWDDDDWCADLRVENQVMLMESTGVPFVGYHSMLFVDESRHEALRYQGSESYALGTSLCFRRELWQEFPFPDKSIGEDNDWCRRNRNVLVSKDAQDMIVARIHDGNTSDKRARRNAKQWQQVAWPEWFDAEVATCRS